MLGLKLIHVSKSGHCNSAIRGPIQLRNRNSMEISFYTRRKSNQLIFMKLCTSLIACAKMWNDGISRNEITAKHICHRITIETSLVQRLHVDLGSWYLDLTRRLHIHIAGNNKVAERSDPANYWAALSVCFVTEWFKHGIKLSNKEYSKLVSHRVIGYVQKIKIHADFLNIDCWRDLEEYHLLSRRPRLSKQLTFLHLRPASVS